MPGSPFHQRVHVSLPNTSWVSRDNEGGISCSLPQPRPSNTRVRHSGSITVPTEGHLSDRASPEAGDSASKRSLKVPVCSTAHDTWSTAIGKCDFLVFN